MDLDEETYKSSPLTPEELAAEILKYYVENITGIKNGQVKESYAVENANIWTEFVKESFITLQDGQDSVVWESYEKAREIVMSEKFLFCLKTFGEIDDNGNGLVDIQEAKQHVNWKKVSKFMNKDKTLDGQVSLAEFLGSVLNPFDAVVNEYKFRYNHYLPYREIRIWDSSNLEFKIWNNLEVKRKCFLVDNNSKKTWRKLKIACWNRLFKRHWLE